MLTSGVHGLSDQDLTHWAREHLVYERRMLQYTVRRLAAMQAKPRGAASNAMLESFAVHVRCLRGFLWSDRDPRNPKHRTDALAADFCVPDAWNGLRGPVPEALAAVDDRQRIGREIVHLSYCRLEVEPTEKDWDVREIHREITEALAKLAEAAMPSRMDHETRGALADPPRGGRSPQRGRLSVPTTGISNVPVSGGTIPFPGFTAGG